MVNKENKLELHKYLTNEINKATKGIDIVRKHYRKDYKKDVMLTEYLRSHKKYQELVKHYEKLKVISHFFLVNYIGDRDSYKVLVDKDKELYDIYNGYDETHTRVSNELTALITDEKSVTKYYN